MVLNSWSSCPLPKCWDFRCMLSHLVSNRESYTTPRFSAGRDLSSSLYLQRFTTTNIEGSKVEREIPSEDLRRECSGGRVNDPGASVTWGCMTEWRMRPEQSFGHGGNTTVQTPEVEEWGRRRWSEVRWVERADEAALFSSSKKAFLILSHWHL